jgi:hypothetical protein
MYILFIQREKTVLYIELKSALASATAAALQVKGYATAYKAHKQYRRSSFSVVNGNEKNTTCSELPLSREFACKRNNLNRV